MVSLFCFRFRSAVTTFRRETLIISALKILFEKKWSHAKAKCLPFGQNTDERRRQQICDQITRWMTVMRFHWFRTVSDVILHGKLLSVREHVYYQSHHFEWLLLLVSLLLLDSLAANASIFTYIWPIKKSRKNVICLENAVARIHLLCDRLGNLSQYEHIRIKSKRLSEWEKQRIVFFLQSTDRCENRKPIEWETKCC